MIGSSDPPKRTAGDVAHALAKGVISAVPFAGGPAAELFALVISPPLERRRDEWMNELAEALKVLEEEGRVTGERLRNSEQFITAALQATQIALRSGPGEKRQALRNAVLNSALPNPPEESEQQYFLRLIDDLTPWHLRILGLFADPEAWYERAGRTPQFSAGSLRALLEDAYPELRGRRDTYDQFWADLRARGLVTTDHLHTMMTGGGLFHRRATTLGERFIKFVSSPL
jgi:hypothetical protein